MFKMLYSNFWLEYVLLLRIYVDKNVGIRAAIMKMDDGQIRSYSRPNLHILEMHYFRPTMMLRHNRVSSSGSGSNHRNESDPRPELSPKDSASLFLFYSLYRVTNRKYPYLMFNKY